MRKLPPLSIAIISAVLLAACGSNHSEQTGNAATEVSRTAKHGAPNIVLILFEDMSPRIGAFGDDIATTPVLDALARESVRFPNTFTAAGVCAPSRAALITGVHQQTLGAQHMRTKGLLGLKGGGPIEYEAVPAADIKAFPELLRAAGYYTSNNYKTDYQFGEPFSIWDESGPDASWRKRRPGQPFFAMITLLKTHESYIWPEDMETGGHRLAELVIQRNRAELAGKPRVTDPQAVEVPPYLPDTAVVRADIARHYDNIAFEERQVQRILDELQADGLLDSTVVIVSTDHGDGLPRMKRSVYDSGIRVPMMIRFPGGENAGEVREELISFVDLAPTILDMAGAAVPAFIQGRDFLSSDFGAAATPARQYIFAASDRVDAVSQRYRAVRDEKFKYIRNFMPAKPFFEPSPFRDAQPTMRELWRLHRTGQLDALQASYFAAPRPAEELYNLQDDPHETVNLAQSERYSAELQRLRRELDQWIERSGDLSAISEIELIERIWPGRQQPLTAAPQLDASAAGGGQQRVSISSATAGASIGYRLGGDPEGEWRLYTGPFTVAAGTEVSAKAIRYGYRESEPTLLNALQ